MASRLVHRFLLMFTTNSVDLFVFVMIRYIVDLVQLIFSPPGLVFQFADDKMCTSSRSSVDRRLSRRGYDLF